MPKVRQQLDIHSNVMDKAAEILKKSTVYTSERIKQISEEISNGGKPDVLPFFHGNVDWKDSGIIFEYTDEELEELDRCACDCEYFVSHYCKFLNSKGRTLVLLRDYQTRLLNTMGEEVYDEKTDTVIPKHPHIVLMQARLTGKCVDQSTSITIKRNNSYINVKLYELYFSLLKDPTILDLAIYNLHKCNTKNNVSKLIYKLEHLKFGDLTNKIIEELPVNLQVKSVNQDNCASMFYRTKAYETWELTLDNGYTLKAADEHLVYSSINYIEGWLRLDQLTSDHYILTNDGWVKVKSVVNTHLKQYMADISVEEVDHSYFSNGVLSHNTTTASAYIAWYACFHTDRNIFICANKGRTASEIMGKVKEVLEGLPYFMKPGVINLSEARMKFENGCAIKCAAASKSPATGDSIQLLYIDEAALIPEGVIEEYWGSVIPTMSSFTNSQIIVSSTPRGKGNRFFKIVDGAVKGENDFYYQRVDWWEVPGHDDAWAKNLKNLLGEELFNREFALSFETRGSRLTTDHTTRFFDKIKTKFVTRDFYSVPKEISDKIMWAPDFDPTTMGYDDLLNRRFLLVVDTAQGIEAGAVGKKDSDYNVINIFEIEAMSPNKVNINRDNKPISTKDVIQYKQVGIYLDNTKDEAQCAEAAKFITFQILKCGVKQIDNVRVLIEINFNGNNWITKFKQHPTYYDAIILKTYRGVQLPGKPISQMKLQYGFRTTGGQHGKNYYCELGGSMMHKRLIIIRQYEDANINLSSIGQLTQFAKTDKGTYMGSCCHDDIAVTCLFVSIAQESNNFIMWVNDWLETTYQTAKIYKIREMLNMYVEQEAQMSDELFHAFYNAAGSKFGKFNYKQNGYGSVMSGENVSSNDNMYGLSNSMNTGFGNMRSGRGY